MLALTVVLRKFSRLFWLLIERLLEQAEIVTLVEYDLSSWGWREPIATFRSFVLRLRSGVLRMQVVFWMRYSRDFSCSELRFAQSAYSNIFWLLFKVFGRFLRRTVLLSSLSTDAWFALWRWAFNACRNSIWLGSSLLLGILKLCFDRLID